METRHAGNAHVWAAKVEVASRVRTLEGTKCDPALFIG